MEEQRVFISYSHADGERVLSLVSEMERRGYRVWYDSKIPAGASWKDTLSERIAGCSVFLAFLSRDYYASPQCRREASVADHYRMKGQLSIVPVKLDGEPVPDNMIFLLDDAQRLPYSPTDAPAAFAERLDREPLFQLCRVPHGETDAGAVLVTREAPTRPSPAFVGRTEKLDELRRILKTGRPVVLRGMGGIGKSEICRKLFQEYVQGTGTPPVKAVGWVTWRGSVRDTFYGQFRAEYVREEQNAAEYWKLAREYMNERGRDLLVFVDNADGLTLDDAAELSELRCRLLVTSRRGRGGRLKAVDAGILSKEDCRLLYRRAYHDDPEISADAPERELVPAEDLDAVLDLAAGHTLTVELLAKTQAANWFSVTELLGRLREKGFDLSGADIEYLHSPEMWDGEEEERPFIEHMSRVFDLSRLRADAENGGAALRVMQGMSLLASNVPIAGADALNWLGQDNESGKNGLNLAIKWGWLDRTGDNVAIHPVIAAVVRHNAMPETEYIDAVAGRLYDDMYVGEYGIFTEKLPLMKHAIALDRAAARLELCTENYANILHQIGYFLHKRAEYRNALEYLHRASEIDEKVLGIEHCETAATYSRIGTAYTRLGDYGKALEWLQKAMEIDETVHGMEHRDTATDYLRIGYLYDMQGNYDKALEWFQKSLRVREKVLGLDHPYTATSYSSIGGVYYSLGDMKKALEYSKKALWIREKVLPPDHPSMAHSYHNIGMVYYEQGDYAEAMAWLEKALAIRLKYLGLDHPRTKATQKWIDRTQRKLSGEE